MNNKSVISETFEKGEGILNLIPNFIPRRFGRPGYRLRLHQDDYFAYGMKRGAIKERWFSSIVPAINGKDAAPDEGMSYVAALGQEKFLFKDAVDMLGANLIGAELYERYGTWPMFAKFFDYSTPLFHHVHLMEEAAALVGKMAKPEAYYFPFQLNNHAGEFPVTYFGFDPSVTMEQVRERLLQFEQTDNRITELSRAYRIQLGTGWYIPAGVVHAPGSYLTYEPQWNSDVNSVFENNVSDEIFPYEMLIENCPEDKHWDIDFILSLMDWEKNVDPDFKKKYYRPPVACQSDDYRYSETWITYANEYFSAKELTVNPGETVTIRDEAAYGCIVIQGHGTFGTYEAEAANVIRLGQSTADEFFVSEDAAKRGVGITNRSKIEPMVILKHFGPNHPGMPKTV